MKYEITDSRLHEAIFKFIDDEFIDDNLEWDYDINPDTDETEPNILNFFGNKYRHGDQDDWYFQYVKREYYTNLTDKEFANKWIKKAPLLEITDREWKEKMTNLFGDYWQPVFKQWFKNVYPHFPVKTFIIR